MLLLPVLAHGKPARVAKQSLADRPPNYFILSIGVDQYQNNFWPDLRWAADDARAVGQKVGRDTRYERHVTVLTDAAASRSAISKAMQGIARRARPQDVVVVYVSSHGTLMADDGGRYEPVVVLSESIPNNLRTTGLAQQELMSLLQPVRAARKLVIYATCHSGLGKSKLPEKVREALAGAKGKVAELDDVSEGTIVLAAAAKGETAREDRKLGGDIYTHFLLQALTTYDRNKDGQVSALEAHDFAKERTYRYTKGRQRATSKAELIGAGDIPLAGRRTKRGLPVLEGYDEIYAGYEVRVNKGQKGRLPLAFPLRPGTSEVEVFAQGARESMATFALRAERGETVQVDELFDPPPFRVGAFVIGKTFSDDKFEKIYGQNQETGLGLRLGAEWQRFQADLFYILPSEGEATVWEGLKSEVTQQSYGAAFGYRYDWWFGLGVGGYGTIGQDRTKLTFKDTNTGTSLSETAEPIFYGIGARVEYRLKSYVAFYHEADYQWLEYDFGRFGSVSGDRFVFTLGASYMFGSKARRIK